LLSRGKPLSEADPVGARLLADAAKAREEGS
jgi:hypothetical protein